MEEQTVSALEAEFPSEMSPSDGATTTAARPPARGDARQLIEQYLRNYRRTLPVLVYAQDAMLIAIRIRHLERELKLLNGLLQVE